MSKKLRPQRYEVRDSSAYSSYKISNPKTIGEKDKNITKVTAKYNNVFDFMLLMAFAHAAGIMGSRGK